MLDFGTGRKLIGEMDLREIGCEDGRWIELTGLWY
jgi:hypothetical protein